AVGGQSQGAGPVLGGVDVVRACLEVDHEGAHDRRLVVDHQHTGHGNCLSGTAGSAGRAGSGTAPAARRVTVMVRPPPGVSSASRVPPIASAKPRATGRPRPTPAPRGASP